MSEFEGFVLVGGKSSRMGESKAFLSFDGGTLLEHAVSLYRSLGLPVHLVADTKQLYEHLGLPVLVDRIPSAGPLGAIWTGLAAADSRHCFFLPSDMPLVPAELFRAMMTLVDGWDAIVPLDSEGNLHPLSAYYSRHCLDPIGTLLDKGERRVGKLLESSSLKVLELRAGDFGIPDDCFLKVNTRKDYQSLF